MAQIIPIYEEIPEFKEIAKNLSERYPDIFGGIDMERVAAVCIVNKDRSEKKKEYFELKTIAPPLTMFCPVEYLFVVFLSDWAEMSTNHRQLLVSQALQKISPDGDGKVVPFDMKDYAVMMRTFGVDYLSNPEVPDILDADVEWKICNRYNEV